MRTPALTAPVATDGLTWDIWVTTITTPPLQHELVLAPIYAATETLRQATDTRPDCPLCRAQFDPKTDLYCSFCLANAPFLRTIRSVNPEAVMTALAAFALHGCRPYLALEALLPNPLVRIACLLHVLTHPALSALWADILEGRLPEAPAQGETWPWPFPYASRDKTALTTLSHERLLSILRAAEPSAIETFRRARWENAEGLIYVQCPQCDGRAWHYHTVSGSGATRWKCMTRAARVAEGLKKARRTDIIRPRMAGNGCGLAFYDTTGTLFSEDRHLVRMADVLPTLFYGEAYLAVLAVGLTPKVLHRLVTRFLTVPVSQQPLVARLRTQAELWVVKTVIAATTITPSEAPVHSETFKGVHA